MGSFGDTFTRFEEIIEPNADRRRMLQEAADADDEFWSGDSSDVS